MDKKAMKEFFNRPAVKYMVENEHYEDLFWAWKEYSHKKGLNYGDLAYLFEISGVDFLGKMDSVPDSCFEDTGIRSIFINNNIKEIGKFAFSRCEKLDTIILSNNVMIIGERAFERCTALKHISLPYKLSEIPYFAFFGCKNMFSLTIPKSVTKIDAKAFYGCDKLIEIDYDGTSEEWHAIDKALPWKEGSKIKIIHCNDGDLTV